MWRIVPMSEAWSTSMSPWRFLGTVRMTILRPLWAESSWQISAGICCWVPPAVVTVLSNADCNYMYHRSQGGCPLGHRVWAGHSLGTCCCLGVRFGGNLWSWKSLGCSCHRMLLLWMDLLCSDDRWMNGMKLSSYFVIDLRRMVEQYQMTCPTIRTPDCDSPTCWTRCWKTCN